MKLELVGRSRTSHSGYGAGSGEVIREEYKCPCGNGEVVYEKDDIPGFKETDISCYCKECDDKYEFGRGTAKEKVI
ncbi:hypothetical protein NDK43_06960 [Neobacillus pocheonensis]|uniref:Uncharacterized protein n=1 Tax=Neobacillus pocheonensis TaxID=363869 RepID=A0ABT0W787_9BACI|nr:hypothetical protein [Neobacillus pocheonensis]